MSMVNEITARTCVPEHDSAECTRSRIESEPMPLLTPKPLVRDCKQDYHLKRLAIRSNKCGL